MRFLRPWLVTLALAHGAAAYSAERPTTPQTEDDALTLASAGLDADGPSLLEFFRARTRADNDADRLLEASRQLGHRDARVARGATALLVGRGSVAVPALRQGANDLGDGARADRARSCLQSIEGPSGGAVVAAAARLVGLRRPAGAASVLLAYLPQADNAAVAEAVHEALAAVAYPGGKAEAALMAGLRDPVALRRAAAAEALCRSSHPELWPELRKLLGDPVPAVQGRVALALVRVSDAESVPALIGLLADLPPAFRADAEAALQELAGDWAPRLEKISANDAGWRSRRDAWAAWWRRTDGKAQLEEFRKRTPREADVAKIQVLIRRLGDDDYATREAASAGLTAYGGPAVPRLREAAQDPDPERARRAEHCLLAIAKAGGRASSRGLPPGTARLLALRQPAGAAEALLAYLPNVDDASTGAEIVTALAALAARGGGPLPALAESLRSRHPARRAAAAVALTRAGVAECRPAVRKLLRDEDAEVRVGVALALAAAGERNAVEPLIAALADAPPEQASKALEALGRLADGRGPATLLGGDAAARRRCRDVWEGWWRERGASVDCAALAETSRLLGYTLVVVHDDDNGSSRVFEVDRDGQVRWHIDGLRIPKDAQILPGNRVLISEFGARRVTERDFAGNILWKKEGLRGGPLNAQRLPSGNTFIATSAELLEVDVAGQEVFRGLSDQVRSGAVVLNGAVKARDGEIFCLISGGMCVRLDATGKELKRFPSGRNSTHHGGIDVLPNGRIIITQPDQSAVVEVDRDGKVHRRLSVSGATRASALSNGHIVVACYEGRRAVELDRSDRAVWEYKDGRSFYRIRRR